MRRLRMLGVTVATLAVGLAVVSVASTPEPVETTSKAYLHHYNLPSSGLAIEGYCPVAYFTVDRPVRGDERFQSTYRDVSYRFASAEAKRLFDANPDRYLPAFGGWCAFGMAK